MQGGGLISPAKIYAESGVSARCGLSRMRGRAVQTIVAAGKLTAW